MTCKFMGLNTFQSLIETILNLPSFWSLHTQPCPLSEHTDRNWASWNLWSRDTRKPTGHFGRRSASFRNPRFLYFPFILSVFYPSRYPWLLLLSSALLVFFLPHLELSEPNLTWSVAGVATVNYGISVNSLLRSNSHPSRFICVFLPISD